MSAFHLSIVIPPSGHDVLCLAEGDRTKFKRLSGQPDQPTATAYPAKPEGDSGSSGEVLLDGLECGSSLGSVGAARLGHVGTAPAAFST